MTIDWIAFTPWAALAGGAIIGGAALLLALVNGRVAGISGIIGGLLRPVLPDAIWRSTFVAGLVVAPIVYALVASRPEVAIAADYPLLIIAGVLVGVGTRYGAGCTSGHGVCGVCRLSRRSIVATLVFMGAGMATVYVARHLVAS